MAQTGDILSGRGGRRYTLGKEMGKGGEGAVYQTEDGSLVAKVFLNATQEQERKILSMLKERIGLKSHGGIPMIAWPQDILYQNGKFAGYVMPCVSGSIPIWNLVRLKDRHRAFDSQEYDWFKGLVVSMNLAHIVSFLHQKGIVIGDMNSNNLLVHNGIVTIIDTDSFDIRDKDTGEHFKCRVGRPEFLPPELQQRNLAYERSAFTVQSDDFALAVHIFQLLFGGHPFNSIKKPVAMLDQNKASQGVNMQVEAIVNGSCPFVHPGQEDIIPPGLPHLSMLPDNLQEDFRRTFTYSALDSIQRKGMRTTADAWYRDLLELYRKKDRELVCCDVNKEHYHLRGMGCGLCGAQERRRLAEEEIRRKVAAAAVEKSTQNTGNQAEDSGTGWIVFGIACFCLVIIILLVL